MIVTSVKLHAQHADALSSHELAIVRDKIIAQEAKIQNMFVQFQVIVDYGRGAPKEIVKYEWATNGEKRYRKSWWPAPVDGPEAKRWGLAVWDGKRLKAFDSELNNGSVRANNDPTNPENPSTYTSYSRQLGHLTQGTLGKLMTKIDLKEWNSHWVKTGQIVVLQNDSVDGQSHSRRVHTWTVDLDRGGLITAYTIQLRNTNGYLEPYVDMIVKDSKEVTPGIWMATQSICRAIITEAGGTRINVQDMNVAAIELNQAEIENKFQFTFPAGSQYYDAIAKMSVVAQGSGSAVDRQIRQTIEEIGQEEKKLATNRDTKSPRTDDFVLADSLIRSRSHDNIKEKRLHWIYWLVAAVITLVITIVFTWMRSRRKASIA